MPLNIKTISLLGCEFHFLRFSNEYQYNLTLTDYVPEKGNNEEKLTLKVEAEFDLMAGVNNPIFSFKCRYIIFYTYDKEDEANVLTPPVIIAHIISYLREFVSTLTARMPGQNHMFFDPVNTHHLWSRYEEAQKLISASKEQTIEEPKASQ